MKKLNDKLRYLVAVSGGPDSMALLDMTRKQNIYLEVAHMNYHHRDSADRDEKIVRNYCKKYNIKFHLANYNPDKYKGNFQNSARVARYDFFKKLCQKNKLNLVLIAHNLDDFIETYYMQKEKGMGFSYYGIKEKNTINDVLVYRPLINQEKSKLLEYCKKNNITFGIDESNLSDVYTRNRIRHGKVEKMSKEEKIALYYELIKLNKENDSKLKRISKKLHNKSFEVNEFLKLEDLDLFLHNQFPKHSNKTIKEILNQLANSKRCVFEGKDVIIFKEYNQINIADYFNEYNVKFNNLNEMIGYKNKYFKINKRGNSFQGVTLSNRDFPVTIRNYKNGDKILMLYGSKGINRFFIDKKISYINRKTWPVLVNKNKEIVLVSGLGCDKNHYSKNHNVFVIKL